MKTRTVLGWKGTGRVLFQEGRIVTFLRDGDYEVALGGLIVKAGRNEVTVIKE